MTKQQIETVIEGLKVLKDRHFYKEVFDELEHLEQGCTLDKDALFKFTKLKAECLYQDKQIPFKIRFEKALDLLNSLKKNDDEKEEPDFLCLIGAVYKRKYQINKDIQDLYSSIKYYKQAAEDILNDDGYGAVNVIFLYKTLLKEHPNIISDNEKENILSLINDIREKALNHLDEKYKDIDNKPKWIDRTYSELYFAEGRYDEAKKHLKDEADDSSINIESLKQFNLSRNTKKVIQRALKIRVAQSRDKLITIEQLIRLYKVQKEKITDEDFIFLENFFEKFISKDKVRNIIRSVFIGKVGLALSGGGFRASFFHIGVLARLAELDILKDIEVISTVSGGSIIGMQYYIRLKELLESKENSQIAQKDYICLVKNIQKDFLKSVQKNIRMKAFEKFNPLKQSITQKLGEIYQEEFYGKDISTMKDLYIYPVIENNKIDNFNPHFNNFEISQKVPVLVVNATCLNNGHNWRFTASGMGESQYMYDTTIDLNAIHKYTRYEDFTKEEFQNFKISDAVASSSCVPGLFDPVELNNSYQYDETIKLVDGGVYDNQGLASLLDEDCDLIICSDASGQFNDENDPSSCRLSIVSRINNALMDRSRDQEYELVKNMFNENKIKGLCITHLKQCFDIKEIAPFDKVDTKASCRSDIYGTELDKEVQVKLSKVRTDLDSFNDVEAYGLMNSGYTIMSEWFEILKQEQDIWKNYEAKREFSWRFLKIREKISSDKSWVLEKLDISRKLFFKIYPWKASFEAGVLFFTALLLLVALIGCNLEYAGGIFVVISVLYKWKEKWLYKIVKYLLKGILTPIGWFNLKFLNEKYIEDGKIK